MTGLDIFALIVLLVLFAAGLGLWLMLGMMPGRIAKSRNHSQVEAVNVCDWVGAMGEMRVREQYSLILE